MSSNFHDNLIIINLYFIHFDNEMIHRIDDSFVKKKIGYIRIRILPQKGFHPILACYKVFLSSSESGETACNSLVYPLLKLWLLHVLYTFFIFWITGLQPLYCLHDFLHETQIILSKSAAIAVLLYSRINTLWPNFNNCLDKSRFKLLSH